jgi:hypothetical protein
LAAPDVIVSRVTRICPEVVDERMIAADRRAAARSSMLSKWSIVGGLGEKSERPYDRMEVPAAQQMEGAICLP